MREIRRNNYNPKSTAAVVDPVSQRVAEIETNVLARMDTVDSRSARSVDKMLKSTVTINGEERSIKDTIYGHQDDFTKALSEALELRHEFYTHAIPNDPENLALKKTEDEKVTAMAYKGILDKATRGEYNGSTELFQRKAEFSLASYFGSAQNSRETIAMVRKIRPDLEGIIFTSEPTDENP